MDEQQAKVFVAATVQSAERMMHKIDNVTADEKGRS